jgi:hypothetical protein
MLQFIHRWFNKSSKTRKQPCRRRQTRSTQLNIEMLEARVTPVIGGTVDAAGVPQLAAVAAPGNNLDGVVSLQLGSLPNGSGSELADQRMILTAAHVLDINVYTLNVALVSGGAGYIAGETFTMPTTYLGNPNGILDAGAYPLSLQITSVGGGGTITGFNVMNQQGNYVPGAAGGLYVAPPPLATASQALVAGIDSSGLPPPNTPASFSITATQLPGGATPGGTVAGQVAAQTVTFNLQRAGAPVNIPITVQGVYGNTISPGGGVVNNMIAPAAWTGNASADTNDIAMVVLRDPNALPGVPAGNLEMAAPFSPFENGYEIASLPAAPAIDTPGANGPGFNIVGYGYTGLGLYGVITQSGIQQIDLAGMPAPGGTFTLNFTPQGGVAAPPTAAISANPTLYAAGQVLSVVTGQAGEVPAQLTIPAGGVNAAGAITALNITDGGNYPAPATFVLQGGLGQGASLATVNFGPRPGGGFRVTSIAAIPAAGTGGPMPVAQNIANALGAVLPAGGQVLVKDNPNLANSYLVRFAGELEKTTPTLAEGVAGGGLVSVPVNIPPGVAAATPAVGAGFSKTYGSNTYDQTSVNDLRYTFKGNGVVQFGGAAVANEAEAAQGDSGGPGLIGGTAGGDATQVMKIVGITSYGSGNNWRQNTTLSNVATVADNNDFGEIDRQTYANLYNGDGGFIKTAENTAYGAVLDMRSQVLGAITDAAGNALPQDPLTITVGLGTEAGVFQAGGPNLLIKVVDTAQPADFQYNGIYFNQPVQTAAGAALITSLVLRGNEGNDTFDVKGNLGIPIRILGGAGNNTVEYLDQANNAATTFQVTAMAAVVTTPAITTLTATPTAGGTAQQIMASNFSTFNLNLGNGGNLVNIQSTNSGTNLNVNAGNGGDTVNVGSTNDAASTLNGILGNVNVSSAQTLNINDQGFFEGVAYIQGPQSVSRDGIGTISYNNITNFNFNEAAATHTAITAVVINQNIPALNNAAGQPALGVQRSMVDDIVYTFSEAVNITDASVDPNVFTIAVAAGWTGTVPTLSWSPAAGSGNTQWAITFSGAGVSGGSIANGAYTITVNHPAAITATLDGQALTLTPTGIGSATQRFYRLFGDINGDEIVNAADNVRFKQALSLYNPAFDSGADGFVNASDNFRFKLSLIINFVGFTPTI